MAIEEIKAPLAYPSYWVVSDFHRKLVNYAYDMLKNRGFQDHEIHQEYSIWVSLAGEPKHHRYLVDVAAIRDGQRCIAVECGGVSNYKLKDLELLFRQVIHISNGDHPVSNKENDYYTDLETQRRKALREKRHLYPRQLGLIH